MVRGEAISLSAARPARSSSPLCARNSEKERRAVRSMASRATSGRANLGRKPLREKSRLAAPVFEPNSKFSRSPPIN